MTIPFKRAAAAGFTLIELLIVVIILAIISAIAIPQFSVATSDAQRAAADANLAAVRSAIELYRTQHAGNVYPGVNSADGDDKCTGEGGAGGPNTKNAFLAQLMYPSDKDGRTCSIANDTYRYGPYLRQGLPVDPFGNSAEVVVTTTGAPLTATANGEGWQYDTKTGQFIMSRALDATASETDDEV